MFQTIRMLTGKSQVNNLLAKHFQGLPLTTLVTAARHFPRASRVDLEVALVHKPNTALWRELAVELPYNELKADS